MARKRTKNRNKSPKYDDERQEYQNKAKQKGKNQQRWGQKREILRMKGQKRKQKRVN